MDANERLKEEALHQLAGFHKTISISGFEAFPDSRADESPASHHLLRRTICLNCRVGIIAIGLRFPFCSCDLNRPILDLPAGYLGYRRSRKAC